MMESSGNVGRVYASLRKGILLRERMPGSKLHIATIADEHGVSPGAVREALTALATERLVESLAQRGFRVAPISIDDLVDLTDVRAEIENIALRKSIARGDLAWEADVVATAYALDRSEQFEADDRRLLNPEWVALHKRFHMALVAACGSPRLINLQTSLYEQAERYRGLSQALTADSRSVKDEHSEIVSATLAKDADRASDLLLAHLRSTTSIIIGAHQRGELPILSSDGALDGRSRRSGPPRTDVLAWNNRRSLAPDG